MQRKLVIQGHLTSSRYQFIPSSYFSGRIISFFPIAVKLNMPFRNGQKLYQNWYVNTFLLLIEESIKLWEITEASERSAIAISSPGSY